MKVEEIATYSPTCHIVHNHNPHTHLYIQISTKTPTETPTVQTPTYTADGTDTAGTKETTANTDVL